MEQSLLKKGSDVYTRLLEQKEVMKGLIGSKKSFMRFSYSLYMFSSTSTFIRVLWSCMRFLRTQSSSARILGGSKGFLETPRTHLYVLCSLYVFVHTKWGSEGTLWRSRNPFIRVIRQFIRVFIYKIGFRRESWRLDWAVYTCFYIVYTCSCIQNEAKIPFSRVLWPSLDVSGRTRMHAENPKKAEECPPEAPRSLRKVPRSPERAPRGTK